MSVWATPALLAGMLAAFALAYAALRRRYPNDPDSLIDAVDALLPQTQCAQCNYPGCRPYAEAIVKDDAPLNLCPPGGAEVHQQLMALMNDARAGAAPTQLPSVVALIDEDKCIGCTLCLPPCPVDAIVGSQGMMHTVITADCTGCELCVPACPVDCISVIAVTAPVQQRRRRRRPQRHSQRQSSLPPRPCIGCGSCNPVCPVDLPAQALLQRVQQRRLGDAVQLGLMNCIDCGLCDQACPSDIPMADLFAAARWAQQQHSDDARTRQRFRDRFEAHNARLAEAAAAASRRRRARLQENLDTGRWQ